MKFIKLISRFIGMLLMAVAWLGGISIGFYVLFASFNIVAYLFGDVVAFLCLLIAPVMMGVAPWFAALRYGDWGLVLLAYGTLPVAMIMINLAGAFFIFGEDDSDS